jgi:hypothetical protein
MDRRFLAGLALAALAAGCSPKPRAPALMQGEAVYHNAQEGFRLLPPPNWSVHARTESTPDKLTEERLLVRYQRTGPAGRAAFDVTMEDVPESEDLAEVIRERRLAADWKPVGSVESLEVGGRPAARGAYQTQPKQGAALLREIVAVRKGGRVYLFTGTFPAGDAKSREQVRKSVATLSW